MTTPGNILVFEDHHLDRMNPITLTRPAFGITCCVYTLYDIVRMVSPRVRYVVRPHLEKIAARRFPQGEHAGGPTLYINASLAPDVRYVESLRSLLARGKPFLSTSGQRIAAALVPERISPPSPAAPAGIPRFLLESNLPLEESEGLRTFDYPFHVVGAIRDLFPANLDRKIRDGQFTEIRPRVFVGRGVRIADTAVLHADDGPIVLDNDVLVMDFCYLRGPLYVGPNSRVIERSSVKEFTSIGNTCKIGGEVEASIIEDYTNKQHHGFLGHSYVGSWVNLGAGTSTSDLKNTYGIVRMECAGERIDTGLQFMGCVIGDFAKAAINTSIFAGKLIGVASMIYGYVGQNVPSFCNYARSFGQVTECPLETAIQTQKRMFARRNVEQTDDDIALLSAVFEMTREERSISSEPPVL